MKSRKIIINKICHINAKSINSKNPPLTICYLDTSNITRNVIENIQFLDSAIAPFPSRAQRIVKNGTIIYSTVRPDQEHFGYIENETKNLIVSTGFLTIDVTDNNVDSKFLYYLLTREDITKYLHTIAVNNVSSYPSIKPDDLGNLEFVIPSDIGTQQKIAAVLTALDAKIKLNRYINAELESIAKTLYDYWFVQYDFPNEKGQPYKSSGGKMIWNNELKRDIPLGWKVKSLSEITDVSTETLNPMNYPDKEFRHYSIPSFDEIGTYKIEKGNSILSNKYCVRVSDILVSKLNPWFSRVVYTNDDSDVICSTEFVVWRTREQKIKNYLYMVARDLSFTTFCCNSASGTSHSHKRVNPYVMMKYKIAFNKDQAMEFGQRIDSILKMVMKNIVETHTLIILRDWLLPMLMNGQVTVKPLSN